MADVQGYSMPDDLYYHKEHMWLQVEDDVATVGMNDFAQQLAGDISYVEPPMEGDEVEQDEVVGTIETGKWMGKLYAPISGEITEINEELEDDATLVNQDPYGEGWMFRMQMSDPAELEHLMQGDAAVEWLKREIAEHKQD